MVILGSLIIRRYKP
ncbi:MAG: hypothetical protein E7641_04700 [Ruminococcaceae bacterium]|nr:hypothetical protein [Oscillospiraceae bacterium]